MLHFNQRININHDHQSSCKGSSSGWYRSFFASALLAHKFKFEKLIHIESDAYLLTKRATDYIDAINSGWTAFWCPKYNWAETAIQVICNDNFAKLEAFRQIKLTRFKSLYAENVLKMAITSINNTLVGDRYGESNIRQTPSMDYYCQCPSTMILKYQGTMSDE